MEKVKKNRLWDFFKNLKIEMTKITWPTSKKLIHDSITSIIIAFILVICISLITGISDKAISYILSLFS